jgi:hypothetical protein
MFAYDEYFPSPLPLWFASSELLADLFHAELNVVSSRLAENPDLPKLFDAPEATLPQRSACFALLAHHKLVKMIDETLINRYEQSHFLGDVESNAFHRTNNLVAADAPAWVLEMNQVVELLPSRMLEVLPEPLRRQGFDRNDDSAQLEAMRSLSTVEQIQAFVEGLLDQQLRRLAVRWSTTISGVSQPRPDQSSITATNGSTEILTAQTSRRDKRKRRRKQDRQRILRDKLIAEIAEAATTVAEFLRMMDERKVQPQITWKDWPGTWVKAYSNPQLRKLIHQDKSRALSRVQRSQNR